MPHKSDPPMGGWDENGNPIWGENQMEHCKGHGTYLHRSKFSGIEWVPYYCRECHSKNRRDKYDQSQSPEPSKGAYTHLIRRREDAKIFKHHVFNGDIPSSFIVFYTVKPGFLLPRKFWSYPIYEPESQD